jgi:N-acetyl-gamma-glutamyl-phosphate reductase
MTQETTTIPIAVVGASGYVGAELLRLLLGHPRAAIAGIYARSSAGQPLAQVLPHFAGRLERTIESFDAAAVAERARVAFSALPHGESVQVVSALAERGVTVLDLSADLRLRDPEVHASWYGGVPVSLPLRQRAVYGLPELYRRELAGAKLVAVPGCYPTGAILAIAPLLAAGLVQPDIIVDAKSGVSGAGHALTADHLYPEVTEGIRAYKVAGAHRHTAEMDQELSLAAGQRVHVMFTPHLAPMSRGILSCVYATPRNPDLAAGAYHEALRERWKGEPFITVLPPGQLPDTSHVRGSNRVHLSVAVDPRARRVLAISAIDNMGKGAAGQAIQCMNIALGLPETAGLDGVAAFP